MVQLLVLCRCRAPTHLRYRQRPRESAHGEPACQKQVHLARPTQPQPNPWDFEERRGREQVCRADYDDQKERI